jgi:hypothetical protein
MVDEVHRPDERPARSSTTVIPHSSNDHIQKRSSGRSKSVSSRTLKTPSWPTTTDHGRVSATAPAGAR